MNYYSKINSNIINNQCNTIDNITYYTYYKKIKWNFIISSHTFSNPQAMMIMIFYAYIAINAMPNF